MDNGEDFGNYSFEKDDLIENDWKFAKFEPPLHQEYKDSHYIKEFNSCNFSITPKVPKVVIRDPFTEAGTSTPFTFKSIPDFDGFKEYSDIFPFKQHNYEFEKCLENLENEEFKGVLDLPTFNAVDHYLSLDVDEMNVLKVIVILGINYI